MPPRCNFRRMYLVLWKSETERSGFRATARPTYMRRGGMPLPRMITDPCLTESSRLAVPDEGAEGVSGFHAGLLPCSRACVLSALLLPAFGYLYLRFRDARTLLWLLGFVFALVSMTLRYVDWPEFCREVEPVDDCASHTSILISSAVFLASLTPSRFRVGRFQVLYVIPCIIPLVIASFLFHVKFHGISPTGLWWLSGYSQLWARSHL